MIDNSELNRRLAAYESKLEEMAAIISQWQNNYQTLLNDHQLLQNKYVASTSQNADLQAQIDAIIAERGSNAPITDNLGIAKERHRNGDLVADASADSSQASPALRSTEKLEIPSSAVSYTHLTLPTIYSV